MKPITLQWTHTLSDSEIKFIRKKNKFTFLNIVISLACIPIFTIAFLQKQPVNDNVLTSYDGETFLLFALLLASIGFFLYGLYSLIIYLSFYLRKIRAKINKNEALYIVKVGPYFLLHKTYYKTAYHAYQDVTEIIGTEEALIIKVINPDFSREQSVVIPNFAFNHSHETRDTFVKKLMEKIPRASAYLS